jgi:hypothetical protein
VDNVRSARHAGTASVGDKMNETKNRYGTIRVAEEMYGSFWGFIKEYKFIPYKIEHTFIDKSFKIDAECSLFEELEEGAYIPFYELETKMEPIIEDAVPVGARKIIIAIRLCR